jgi:hypothetical protein
VRAAGKRLGEEALVMQQFINAMRAVLRKDPLYFHERADTEEKRFYVHPVSIKTGMTPRRGAAA